MTKIQQSNQLRLVVIAGPNGSGKSTITTNFQSKKLIPGKYINADVIELSLTEPNLTTKSYQAAIIAEEQRQICIRQKESFTFETVMSHPSKLEIMRQAVKEGYQVELIFVATSNVEVNIDRVKQRVLEGGHDVPTNKIRERYDRTIKLLPAAAEIANIIYLFDNTQTPKLETKIENGQVTYQSDNMPLWVRTTVQKLEERKRERAAINKTANKNQQIVDEANINSGIYTGVISQIKPHYIIQKAGDSLILHDRSIIKENFNLDRDIRIAYYNGNVNTSIQPNQEDRQWAEGIATMATTIFQSAKQSNKVETLSRGIELFKGNNYQLQVNHNTETLTISSIENNRLVTSYNLNDLSVIAANPTEIDKQSWVTVNQPSQINLTQNTDFEL